MVDVVEVKVSRCRRVVAMGWRLDREQAMEERGARRHEENNLKPDCHSDCYNL